MFAGPYSGDRLPLDAASSTARDELRRISEEIAITSTAERDEAQRRFDRMQLPTLELDKAKTDLTALGAEYDAQIAAWYADDCAGHRPAEPTELMELENAVRRLTQDSTASRPSLEAARTALDEANVRFGRLHQQKQSAVYRAVVEAAVQHLHSRALPAMVASLQELAVAKTLAAELRRIGVSEPEALSAAHEIERNIFETRSSIAVRGNMTAATAFIAAIADDPMAELPVPQAEIVRLDPPVMRPLGIG